MGERNVPTEPGWWWRCDNRSERWCADVYLFGGEPHWTGGEVTDDGCWLAPVASPEAVEALHAEVAELRRQLAEARDAERDAVVAWLCEHADAAWNDPVAGVERWSEVRHVAERVADNAHRVTP